MSQRLSGKTALVTGSTSNIGRSVAQLFAAEGAHVIVSGRDQARGESVVAGIRDRGGRADFIRGSRRQLPPGKEFPGEALVLGTPAGQAGHPDAIASAALYLASDEAAFIHGTVIDVDGGRVGVAVTASA